ncbi:MULTISPECIES: PadR family transcriptional regulator [unclassified Microbacterium]|uniref:PadR family transcriptional regulator n=1 Tax=unclassified Microbacterium TaxID=2609290 RepID=UPI0016054101|nr:MULTISPECIES: PadR family transcriptional regulator [unclassified Microbacterium]QNA93434.1 PadR family transcriptional regulator [Microbacterium sp. Se63.02b]QYM63663.1 PadR family transcriptional regulator [Microbacterium sp. Se5.02b]
MTADIGAQMRKGVVEYCVLGLLAREPMYGWQLAEALTSAGLIASIGTLYPLLGRLRDNGWVSTFDLPSESGPVRKYYRLTEAGTEQLDRFRAQWAPFARVVTGIVGEGRS